MRQRQTRPGSRWRAALAVVLSAVLLVLFAGVGQAQNDACCPCSAQNEAPARDTLQRPPCCAESETVTNAELAVVTPPSSIALAPASAPPSAVASFVPSPTAPPAARVRGPPRTAAYIRHHALLL